ncbi:MAG TPA: DUF72 domain-containing protein [Candidatus Dormibacteraeota bacterium]|nr:DUF72 domain-containing protein [Candidatus Dormibacteraeota bacterium]
MTAVETGANPHDPGVEAAAARAEEVGDAAARPIVGRDGHEFRVGTASWTDPTMTAPGVFYPPGASSAEERLRYYASRFPLVEVDSTYYALPQESMSQRWAERTPDGFVFDIKAHALMTGQPTETKRLPKPIREALPEAVREKARVYPRDVPPELIEEVWAYFRNGIEPLRASGKLGAVFLQFPRWVFPSNETREHILLARERLGGLPIAVEFRHGSWFNEKNADRTLRFLTDNAIPYVIVDEPQGFKSSVPPVAATTSPELAVIRFHGRRAETWEQRDVPPSERFRYLYDEDELADWIPALRDAGEKAKQTHVLMNNCFSNYGTTNALEIARLLQELERQA